MPKSKVKTKRLLDIYTQQLDFLANDNDHNALFYIEFRDKIFAQRYINIVNGKGSFFNHFYLIQQNKKKID